MNLLQHFTKQRSHLDQLAGVGGRQFFAPGLKLHHRTIGEVPDAFEIGDELQTREQFACLGFTYAGDGFGELVIDLALDLVEFLLAILDREKSQARTVGEILANIEDGVAGDQAAADDQGREFVFGQILTTAAEPIWTWERFLSPGSGRGRAAFRSCLRGRWFSGHGKLALFQTRYSAAKKIA